MSISLTALRQQTSERLRSEATGTGSAARDAAAQVLCSWYVVLRSDDRYSTSEMLQDDAAKVRRRLISIGRRRAAQLKRAGVECPVDLTQQVDRRVAAIVAESLSTEPGESASAANSRQAALGGGAIADEAWQLVALIQRVIAPDFWEPSGGPGAIHYFAIKRALVVRATSDVHEQVHDLLQALR